MIPIQEANRLITGLNQIAQGVTALAAVIEDAAWAGIEDHYALSGPRPIAAAQLHQPAIETAAAEDQPALPVEATPATDTRQESNPAPAVQVEVVSLEQVRAVLAELSQAGLTEKVRELIQATGAHKLSEVDPAKYGSLLEAARGLGHA